MSKESPKIPGPEYYWRQMAYKMSEDELQDRAKILHDDFKKKLEKDDFTIRSSNYRGKTDVSLKRRLEMISKKDDKHSSHFLVSDLCGIRFTLETNEKIDQAILWFENEFSEDKHDGIRVLRIRDFRKDEIKEKLGEGVMQPEYKAVHIVYPYKIPIDGKVEVDYVEIQLMTSEQERINKSTRGMYEKILGIQSLAIDDY